MENYGRDDTTLKLLVFHGTRRADAEQHWFTCEAIWDVKQTLDDQAKIGKLETTLREIALTWCMKSKETTLSKEVKCLVEIK